MLGGTGPEPYFNFIGVFDPAPVRDGYWTVAGAPHLAPRSLLRLSTSGWNLVALQSGKGLASFEKPRSYTRFGQAARGADITSYVLHIQHLRGFDAGRPTVALPMIVLL